MQACTVITPVRMVNTDRTVSRRVRVRITGRAIRRPVCVSAHPGGRNPTVANVSTRILLSKVKTTRQIVLRFGDGK